MGMRTAYIGLAVFFGMPERNAQSGSDEPAVGADLLRRRPVSSRSTAVTPPRSGAEIPVGGDRGRDATGLPGVNIRHPPNWEVTTVAAGRVQLMPAGQSFQMIVSAFRGQTETDERFAARQRASASSQSCRRGGARAPFT
jgi:hypothetical protein